MTLKYFLLQMMDVLKDDMEDGELDSSDGEDLGGYTPLQVSYIKCSFANAHCASLTFVATTCTLKILNHMNLKIVQRPSNPKPHTQPPPPSLGRPFQQSNCITR